MFSRKGSQRPTSARKWQINVRVSERKLPAFLFPEPEESEQLCLFSHLFSIFVWCSIMLFYGAILLRIQQVLHPGNQITFANFFNESFHEWELSTVAESVFSVSATRKT